MVVLLDLVLELAASDGTTDQAENAMTEVLTAGITSGGTANGTQQATFAFLLVVGIGRAEVALGTLLLLAITTVVLAAKGNVSLSSSFAHGKRSLTIVGRPGSGHNLAAGHSLAAVRHTAAFPDHSLVAGRCNLDRSLVAGHTVDLPGHRIAVGRTGPGPGPGSGRSLAVDHNLVAGRTGRPAAVGCNLRRSRTC